MNELCRDHEERLEVRFYGHYSATLDCAKVANLPDAQSLSIICLQTAWNVEAIRKHSGLRRSSFGIYRHDQTDLLERIEAGQLRELRLDENAGRIFDLAPLARYGTLESLSLEGYTKGIDSLTSHPRLRSLGLRCIRKKKSLDFVSTIRGRPPLPALRRAEAPHRRGNPSRIRSSREGSSLTSARARSRWSSHPRGRRRRRSCASGEGSTASVARRLSTTQSAAFRRCPAWGVGLMSCA